jgi:TIR domain
MADDTKIAEEKLKIFISYSTRDTAGFAGELLAGLELAGFAPFMDVHDIKPGEPWEDRLAGLIAQSDTVLFVITPEAMKSEYRTWEVKRTLELSKRLLPVLLKPVPENEIPEQLRRLNFVRFNTGRALNRSITELVEALRTDLDWIREHTRLGALPVLRTGPGSIGALRRRPASAPWWVTILTADQSLPDRRCGQNAPQRRVGPRRPGSCSRHTRKDSPTQLLAVAINRPIARDF